MRARGHFRRGQHVGRCESVLPGHYPQAAEDVPAIARAGCHGRAVFAVGRARFHRRRRRAFGRNRARQFTSARTGLRVRRISGILRRDRVTEAYAQAVVPLVRDRAFAKSMEADLAARSVHYSQAGSELPWKLGLSWVPVQGLRVRFTASEDIRAPNVLELNLPQFMSSISSQVNPLPDGVPLFNSLGFAPGQSLNVREIGGGNPALDARSRAHDGGGPGSATDERCRGSTRPSTISASRSTTPSRRCRRARSCAAARPEMKVSATHLDAAGLDAAASSQRFRSMRSRSSRAGSTARRSTAFARRRRSDDPRAGELPVRVRADSFRGPRRRTCAATSPSGLPRCRAI